MKAGSQKDPRAIDDPNKSRRHRNKLAREAKALAMAKEIGDRVQIEEITPKPKRR
jgi:hypothetical protein